ncbi:MAG: hypothetical protein JJT94_00495 [Bernardetiaceae bacterium]|nr:hypothetical protein [Bernardetiaceae bacterium]
MKTKISVLFVAFLWICFLPSCKIDPEDRAVDSEEFYALKRSTEIKKVNEADILTFAQEKGELAYRQISKLDTIGTFPTCGTHHYEFADSLDLKAVARIDFVCESPKAEKEKSVFEAYQTTAKEMPEMLLPNVQKIEDESMILYTVPKTKGDTLGMWSIRLSRKIIVQSL